eukprot:UN24735
MEAIFYTPNAQEQNELRGRMKGFGGGNNNSMNSSDMNTNNNSSSSYGSNMKGFWEQW